MYYWIEDNFKLYKILTTSVLKSRLGILVEFILFEIDARSNLKFVRRETSWVGLAQMSPYFQFNWRELNQKWITDYTMRSLIFTPKRSRDVKPACDGNSKSLFSAWILKRSAKRSTQEHGILPITIRDSISRCNYFDIVHRLSTRENYFSLVATPVPSNNKFKRFYLLNVTSNLSITCPLRKMKKKEEKKEKKMVEREKMR